MSVIPIARVSCLNSSNDYKVAYAELLGLLRERWEFNILSDRSYFTRGASLCSEVR